MATGTPVPGRAGAGGAPCHCVQEAWGAGAGTEPSRRAAVSARPSGTFFLVKTAQTRPTVNIS